MDHDDFDQEPIRGLPRMLPEGERMLWQGAPSARALARDALKWRWVAGYFVGFFLWSFVVQMAATSPASALLAASFYLVAGAVACALLFAVAWAQARATVYTVTDRRVVMRIGAALTMTLQFPYRWIGAADLDLRPDGTGTIAFRTLGDTRFSYLMVWPHARPWRFAKTQPAFRCIPDAAAVARLIAETAGAETTRPVVTADAPPPRAAAAPDAVPAE